MEQILKRLNEYIDREYQIAKPYKGTKDGSHNACLYNSTSYYQLIKLRDEMLKASKGNTKDE